MKFVSQSASIPHYDFLNSYILPDQQPPWISSSHKSNHAN